MAKKKDDLDVAADFFGDGDLDWMDDGTAPGGVPRVPPGSEMPISPESPSEQMPVAPPPPPPVPPGQRTATPVMGGADAGWSDKVSEAPPDLKKLSQAPTLVFSSVPTLPPQPSPAQRSATPPPPPALDDDGPVPTEEASAADAPTVEIDRAPPPHEEDKTEVRQEDPPSEAVEPVFGDAFQETEEPLVRTSDPSPARVQTPPPATRREGIATPPPVPRRVRYAPPGVETAWRQAATTLVAEASRRDQGQRGQLLFEAAEIYHRRVDDRSGAETLYRDAVAAGHGEPRLFRGFAELLGQNGAYDEQANELVALAAREDGEASVDALIEAGLLLSRRLQQHEGAAELLRQAAAISPADYISRALLRALLPSVPEAVEERLGVLEQLAQLSEGGIAADALVERAIVLEQLGRLDASIGDLRKALALEPGHTVAFLRLERLLAGDGAAQADLFIAEAQREGQPDPGWWWYKAARALHVAGDGERAQDAYNRAIQAGYVFAERERQAAWTRTGAHSELVQSLAHEVDAVEEGEARAFAAFRLGWARETLLSDREGALAAYRLAVANDAHATPAADGVSRLLAVTGSADDLRAFWDERLASAPEAEQPYLQLRIAEIAETAGDLDAAGEGYRAALAADGLGVLAEVAAAGLARVLEAQESWDALADLLAGRAERSDDMRTRVAWLRRAAAVGPRSVHDPDRSRRMYEEVLSLSPDDPESLEAMAGLLGHSDSWANLADLLKVAGNSCTEPARRSALLYRAARVFVDRCDDASSARPCLEASVAAGPDFLPALWLLREACGVAEPRAIATMYRQQASTSADPAAQAWALVASASMSGPGDPQARQDLRQVLQRRPDHPGAVAAMEVRCLVDRDQEGLISVCRGALTGTPDRPKALLALRLADLLVQVGRPEEAKSVLADLATWEVDGRPLRAAARAACTLGAWSLVGDLLAPLPSAEDQLERARIMGQYADPSEALALYQQLLDGPHAVAVGSRASTVAQRAGDRDAMVEAYGAIARAASGAPLIAAYAAWTAMQLEGMGQPARALDFWQLALEQRPDSTTAFYGAARCLVATSSVEALQELFTAHRPDAHRELADHLLAAEGHSEASAALGGALDAAIERGASAATLLPLLVVTECVREQSEDWQGTYDACTLRRDHTTDPNEIAAIDGKRRWLLAEKLADTDAAWEQYRKLHDDAPEDREVTEALARIAGARGETEMAIGYLRELAHSAGGPEDAARYQRRIGEVYEHAGDVANARQAFLDALDYVNDDPESLEGLKRLALQSEDWPGLIAVLQREVNLSEGARELELCREIAKVTEERLTDALVAIDSWRAVLERSPADRQALERLVELSEQQAEWGTFVEAGDQLAAQLDGPEKGAILRRVGVVCQDQLERADAVRFFERAVSVEPPDHDAAVRLEELYRGRADWGGAIRVLQHQAQADVDVAIKVEALLRAARLEIEANHDREAGSDLYARVLDLQPEHEGALRFMASHLFEAGRFDEALPICERLEPIVEQGQDLDDFDTRMELASFYFYMAEMLRLQLEEERAVPRYERALDLNSTHLATLEAVGPLYIRLERWPEAQKVYRQLLQLSGGQGNREKVADTYTSLGIVEHALGNDDKAQKRFSKALELHPNHVPALKGMAMVLEGQAVWSSLLNVYNNIICHATDADDVKAAYMTKGRILDEHMQRQDKAAQHYQRSLDFEPDQPVAYLRLAELAMRRDAYQEAGALANKGMGLDEYLVDEIRPLLLLVRAVAHQDGGKAAEAEKFLAEALAADSSLEGALGSTPLSDLEALRQVLKERLPR